MKEKILTQEIVRETGLDKVSVITADMLDGYTSIGCYAFYYCCGLTSIEIPNSVTSIGNKAFEGCPGLTYPVYNAHVFAYMPTSYSGAYTIPAGIESIAGGAFAYCTGLTSVTIPNSVTSIGDEAFHGCSGLTSVTIPNSVTSIGDGAFYDCSGLASIVIPNSVTSIGNCAFAGCTGLASVTIPNSVTSIGDYAFQGCTGLTSVTIWNKKYKTQEVKDGKCKAYKAFNADMTCREFQYDEGKTYDFNGESKLCEQGFHACLNLADVFRYYYGEFGKDIVVHEVELEGVSDERKYDSKVVAKKITIGKRIL